MCVCFLFSVSLCVLVGLCVHFWLYMHIHMYMFVYAYMLFLFCPIILFVLVADRIGRTEKGSWNRDMVHVHVSEHVPTRSSSSRLVISHPNTPCHAMKKRKHHTLVIVQAQKLLVCVISKLCSTNLPVCSAPPTHQHNLLHRLTSIICSTHLSACSALPTYQYALLHPLTSIICFTHFRVSSTGG